MSMPPPKSPPNASLSDSNKNQVIFQFNPNTIAISHANQQQATSAKQPNQNPPGGAGGGASGTPMANDSHVTNVGPTTISLSKLIFDGDNAVTNCKQLLQWSYPNSQGSTTSADLTKLTFSWGSINYPVTIQSVDLTYERFTSTGTPIRATVNLKLQYEGTPPPGTNPTSGGIPGRRSHILVAGENLQHVAMANYGKPGAWRALAAANGIENPLAVQPGTLIYLPAPAELADEGAR